MGLFKNLSELVSVLAVDIRQVAVVSGFYPGGLVIFLTMVRGSISGLGVVESPGGEAVIRGLAGLKTGSILK